MNKSKKQPDPIDNGCETGTLELLRKIQQGKLDAKGIAVGERRQLVAYLQGDGFSTADIAQVLKASDRTIERDKKAIREHNAIERDPKLLEQMVGRLVGEAELSIQQLRKTARDKSTASGAKIDAYHRCYQIVSDLTEKLQRLGYLPTASHKVEASLTHHVAELPQFNELHDEVKRLKLVSERTIGGDPESTKQLALLESQITQADLASQVAQVSEKINSKDGENHEQTTDDE